VMSGGRLDMELYSVGELVPSNELLDATGSDVTQLHPMFANMWAGRNTAFELFCAYPFGPTQVEYGMWYSGGDGQKYLDILYPQYNIQAFPWVFSVGQIGGHSKFPITSIDDMVGKTYRQGAGMPHLILRKLGIDPIWLPQEECYSNLDRGVVDIIKWGGPSEDWGMKLHEIAEYMFWPGWHKPGFAFTLEINHDRYHGLPEDLQRIVYTAAWATAGKSFKRAYEDAYYFQKFVDYGTTMTKLPPEELAKLKAAADECLAELADENPIYKEIWQNQQEFVKAYKAWSEYSSFPSLD